MVKPTPTRRKRNWTRFGLHGILDGVAVPRPEGCLLICCWIGSRRVTDYRHRSICVGVESLVEYSFLSRRSLIAQREMYRRLPMPSHPRVINFTFFNPRKSYSKMKTTSMPKINTENVASNIQLQYQRRNERTINVSSLNSSVKWNRN